MFGSSFRRFFIRAPLPDGFRDESTSRILRSGFVENLAARSDEPNAGWVAIGTAKAPTCLNEWLFTNYAALSIRIDQKRINARQFKIRLDERFSAVMAEKGVERLGKSHRDEIRDALKEELLARALPSTAIVDLLWDVTTGEVLVFSTSAKVVDLAVALFRSTFEADVYPSRLVDLLTGKDGLEWTAVDDACSHITGQVPLPLDEIHSGDPLRTMASEVAGEFLLWTWFKTEQDCGTFETPQGSVDVWVDDSMRLATADESPRHTSFKGGAPSTTPEAKLSVISGQALTDLRIGIRKGENEYSATLRNRGGVIEIARMELPTVVKDGTEEIVYERGFLIEKLQAVVSSLFRDFMRQRAGDWVRVDGEIKEWLTGENE